MYANSTPTSGPSSLNEDQIVERGARPSRESALRLSAQLEIPEQPIASSQVTTGTRGRLYRSTSKALVAAEEPFTKTSSVYFPGGHPSGFAMWNSVLALPAGAIV